MPRTPENLVRHELIGLAVDVTTSTDPEKEGVTGTVVDETRGTLVVETPGGEEQTLPKAESRFRFELEDTAVGVDGDLLVGRPEERILKKFPRKWEYADSTVNTDGSDD